MTIPHSALLVDDEAHIRLFLKLILQELGIAHIREARNGQEAIEAYRQARSDIVLMDVNMAGMDGLAALALFKEEFPDSFIIMVTSTATRDIVEKCIHYGVKQYIRKDTPKADILTILRSTFERMTFPPQA